MVGDEQVSSTTTRREPVPRMPSVSQLSTMRYAERGNAAQRVSPGGPPSALATATPPMKCVPISQPVP
jgi:hypothetical protein